jgi:hypothetical protein
LCGAQNLLGDLETDIRHVMEPNTATSLKVRACLTIPTRHCHSCCKAERERETERQRERETERQRDRDRDKDREREREREREGCSTVWLTRSGWGARVQESKKNSLKDFVHVAGPLGVSHFL